VVLFVGGFLLFDGVLFLMFLLLVDGDGLLLMIVVLVVGVLLL
jgi:hypothetical protein